MSENSYFLENVHLHEEIRSLRLHLKVTRFWLFVLVFVLGMNVAMRIAGI